MSFGVDTSGMDNRWDEDETRKDLPTSPGSPCWAGLCLVVEERSSLNGEFEELMLSQKQRYPHLEGGRRERGTRQEESERWGRVRMRAGLHESSDRAKGAEMFSKDHEYSIVVA
eukprot:756808-Hanusia_phi.AAC.4